MTDRPTGGGSYIRHPDGRLERHEEPTQQHPEGDAPRTAEGLVIGADGVPMDPPPAPEPEPEPATDGEA